MVTIILLGILALAAVFGLAMRVVAQDEEIKLIGTWVFGGSLVLFFGLACIGSVTIVPARTIAVQTSFGKPVDTLGNGLHLVTPWSATEEFDATVQTLRLSGDKEDSGEPITVRLANSATAVVDVTAQWQIDPKADVTGLYLDYKTFDNIGTNVVRRQLAAALNTVFESYDPLAALKGSAQPVTLDELAKRAQARLEGVLPGGIKLRSILVPKVSFDGSVQSKIDQYLATVAETQIAEQRKRTAVEQKAANDLLATANNNAGVLYQNCLDMVERLTKDGKTLPPAFSCGNSKAAVNVK